jgi:uncharacterized membrane protein YhiD involved in acid resistance
VNNILSAIRNPNRLTCAWVPTGDARTPLICVWKEASPSLVTRISQSSLEDETGGYWAFRVAEADIRTLLLSTISHLPVTLQSIHGEQEDANNQAQIAAVMRTVGRNNEAIEQVVVRLSMEELVAKISWSIVEAAME